MSTYKGKPVTIAKPASEIYAKISDLGQYKPLIDNLPEEQRARLQGVEFTGDSVKMAAPGVGNMEFKIAELQEPSHVALTAVGLPMPLMLHVHLNEADGSTVVSPSIDINIPMMLRPFLGPKIQEAADKFGEVFTSVFLPS